MSTKFKDWFENNLVVGRYPLPHEIEKSDFDCIVNVSDELIMSCYNSAVKNGKLFFWFPLNECTSDMGINSIYGALQVIRNAEELNQKVYLHCHAGVNRSQTVYEAYYRMRTGHDFEKKRYRMDENIRLGRLPSENKMNNFLTKCNDSFNKDETHRGGMLDDIKLKCAIN